MKRAQKRKQTLIYGFLLSAGILFFVLAASQPYLESVLSTPATSLPEALVEFVRL